MKHFVIVKGGIARIMHAVDSVDDPMDEISRWHPDDQAQVTSVRAISESDIPPARSVAIRDAWEDDGTSIIVNMDKARLNTISRIRPERDRRLAADDIAYMRADEAADAPAKAHIAARKQKLRDLPATIQPDLAELDTPEVLEAYQPAWPE